MTTHKEMSEQFKLIFLRLFSDIREVASAGAQGDAVWFPYIMTKIDTLTLEEQELCLRYLLSSKLESMLIDFMKTTGGFGDKPL